MELDRHNRIVANGIVVFPGVSTAGWPFVRQNRAEVATKVLVRIPQVGPSSHPFDAARGTHRARQQEDAAATPSPT